MKYIIKKTFIFLIPFFTSLNCFALKQKVLIVGDSGYIPYSYSENDIALGIYTQIIKKISTLMKNEYEIEVKLQPWKRAISMVEKGEAFAVYPPYYNPQKRPWMAYSDPLYTEEVKAFCNEDGNFPELYSGKKMAINSGFIFPETFYAIIKLNNIELKEAKDNNQALEMLKKKSVDCYANDVNSVKYSNKSFKLKLFEKKDVLFKAEAFLGFSQKNIYKFKFTKDFITKFNSNLNKLKKEKIIENEINQFLKK